MRCPEFYKKFRDDGNFCERSPEIAKQILNYVDYCKRHGLNEGTINLNALTPLIKIEGMVVHDMALKVLKERLSKELRPKDVSRPLVTEIINNVNLRFKEGDPRRLPEKLKLKNTSRYEHSIRGISFNVRRSYNDFKESVSGGINNNEFLLYMINYCNKNSDDFKKFIEEE